ncbi:MAG TPA: 2-oxoglutarate dehydrogenase E1 component [Vicinamibacterales bacterium]|nr:2-oxoglutarate dehydrogenase E1 component [Vicinamibacterales bacterium]
MSSFGGINEGYVLELYERYRQDPSSVDPATRAVFDRGFVPEILSEGPPEGGPHGTPAGRVGPVATPAATLGAGFSRPATAPEALEQIQKIVATVNLAECIRKFGHLAARIDPLGSEPIGDPSLTPENHGLSEDDLRALPAWLVGGPAAEGRANAWEAVEALRRVYCSSTGYDYAHIFPPEERAWLRDAAEAGRFRPPNDPLAGPELLDRITQVETFERFLHRTFPGKTRFSIEGLDMLVPVLDEIIVDAASAGVKQVFIGMAHRGRLNVLAHVLQRDYATLLAAFKESKRDQPFHEDLGWTGDVKYHAGGRTAVRAGGELTISLPPNPSHLEAVDPVVVGMARAAATDATSGGRVNVDPSRTLAILIHGDAAFPGQGVVAETLNLSRLPGYQVGGTIHIIANNQLGFTATGRESYSTSYASGMARGFKIPIVHVNADDVPACIEAARLAIAYRSKFRLDFLIDLIGYRRHGHNEGDEPSFTQPVMYAKIARHPTVRERWARELQEQGVALPAPPEALVRKHTAALEQALAQAQDNPQELDRMPESPPRGIARRVATAVPLDKLRTLNAALSQTPEGFTVHKKLERIRERRKTLLDDPDAPTIDWAAAEELALASVLADGIPIRFTGEDVERGTFSHRHAVLHDAVNGKRYVPLQNLPGVQAAFEIRNSPLTENATVGFEFGYSIQQPERLVIWEAQYGDFVNGAQVMIDEFIASGRAKWGLLPSLVMLLPHGYEGQGPDHSSARVERFLELAADINLRIANCTTSAQFFHLLRRQAALLKTDPLPLIVLTPKSLLRHPATASRPRDLAEGRFQPVLADDEAMQQPRKVRRLLLCSGKVYVDLATSELRPKDASIAICRVEQLYPFPWADLKPVFDALPELDEVVWVQEEPENMGAWPYMRVKLEDAIEGRWPLRYVGRARSASPAEGAMSWHAVNQRTLIAEAFQPEKEKRQKRMVLSKTI